MIKRVFVKIKYILIALLCLPLSLAAQINTDRVMDIGRNALYFEDYVLSIQYFNQVINSKPYLCEPYFFRGLAKLNLEDYIGAEEDCTVAIDCNPYVVSAYQVRGLARINMEDYDGAASDYEFALKYDPENIGVLHNISMCYLGADRYAKADSILDYLLKVSPRYNNAYILKAQVAVEEGDTLKALKYTDIAVERDPYESQYWSVRATLRLMREDYANAETDLTQAIRLGINNAGNYINRAMARYYQKNLRGAMSDYDEALDLEPNNYIGLYNRALLRAQVGDDNRAIEDFDKVIKMNPKNFMAIFNRALLRENTGDYNGAIKDYTFVLEKYNDFAYGYQRRAELYRKTGQNNLALKDEDKLLRMALDQQFGKKKKDTSKTRKESDDDMDNYNKLVVADENEFSGYNNDYRGRVQNNRIDIKMQPLVALTYYDKASELQNYSLYYKGLEKLNSVKNLPGKFILTTRERPLTEKEAAVHFALINERDVTGDGSVDTSVSRFLRAVDFYLVQDFDSALSDLEAVILANPEFVEAYFLRANILCKKLEVEKSMNTDVQQDAKIQSGNMRINDYGLVVRDLDRAIELAPDFAFAYYNRACVEAMQKDFISAIADLNKTLELDASFAEAYYNRGLINIFLGNNKQGIADLSRAGELGIASSYNVIKRFIDK